MSTPARFDRRRGALLVVDMQVKLLAKIPGAALLTINTARLAQAAALLEIPIFATEQYPKGLGLTVDTLAPLLGDPTPKMTFHALGAPGLTESLESDGIRHITLAGIEAHICVAQTALELLARGYRVQIAVDAVDSRHPLDRDVALRRLDRAGATITTVEAALFEWVETADHPRFKAISALVLGRAEPGGSAATVSREVNASDDEVQTRIESRGGHEVAASDP